MLLGIPALALIGALALACFAKVAGVVFLGSPRSERAASASETGSGMASLAPMLLLALICIVLGVVPSLGIALVNAPARALTGAPQAGIPDSVAFGAWAITLLALSTITLVALSVVGSHPGGTRGRHSPRSHVGLWI